MFHGMPHIQYIKWPCADYIKHKGVYMTTWQLDETREHILRLYGRPQLDLTNPSLRSVVDRQEYARIHYHDALDTLDSFAQAKLQATSLLEVFFLQAGQISTEFQMCILKIGAYVTACIQSLHAVADILGHAIYFGLAMNMSPKPLANRAITASSVRHALNNNPELRRLRTLYEKLGNEKDFAHLTALTNHSKHRSVILPSINEDQTGLKTERHSLRLSAFEYDGKKYPEVSIKEFLTAAYDHCAVLSIEIGNELNTILSARMPVSHTQ